MVAVLMLFGCAAQEPVPENNFYRLRIDAPQQPGASILNGTLAVGPLQGNGLVGGRAMVYSEASLPLQLRQYHYHNWIESPPRLLQEQLVLFLRTAGVAKRVISSETGAHAEYLVSGKIHKLLESRSSSGASVTVGLELALIRARDMQIMLLKDYEQTEVVAKENTMHDVVKAYGLAVSKLYKEFLHDLRAQN
jgi:ABC-type uncharacterized transport system auxiliary subunit